MVYTNSRGGGTQDLNGEPPLNSLKITAQLYSYSIKCTKICFGGIPEFANFARKCNSTRGHCGKWLSKAGTSIVAFIPCETHIILELERLKIVLGVCKSFLLTTPVQETASEAPALRP